MKLRDWIELLRIQLHREEGQTMAEYGVVIALITLGVVAAITTLALAISGKLGAGLHGPQVGTSARWAPTPGPTAPTLTAHHSPSTTEPHEHHRRQHLPARRSLGVRPDDGRVQRDARADPSWPSSPP